MCKRAIQDQEWHNIRSDRMCKGAIANIRSGRMCKWAIVRIRSDGMYK